MPLVLKHPIALFIITMSAAALVGCGSGHKMTDPSSSKAGSATVSAVHDRSAQSDAEDSEDAAIGITAPATITQPGVYRLLEDATITHGDGIHITASHVRLLLGRHLLTGPGDKSGRAVVVDGASDVLVRGGQIRRFGIGVALLDASNCRVRGVSIEGGDATADPANGNPPQIGMMLVNSAHDVIARNTIDAINLGLFVRGGGSTDNLLLGNTVTGAKHGLLGICYNPAPTGGAAGPYDDVVRENVLSRFGTGISTSAGSQNNYFVGNTLQFFDAPWVDKNGSNVFERNRTEQVAR